MSKFSIVHADCGGDWTHVDGKAYCGRCGHVQDVTCLDGFPIISGCMIVPEDVE